ncbi:hypothetical protein [Clostridium sp. ZBS15]|nr:hypothetical protein [Clostridium sp. ZBS15]
MKIIEVLGLYTKDYLSNGEFEEWVYDNDEELNRLFADTIYYEIISTNYNDNRQVVS